MKDQWVWKTPAGTSFGKMRESAGDALKQLDAATAKSELAEVGKVLQDHKRWLGERAIESMAISQESLWGSILCLRQRQILPGRRAVHGGAQFRIGSVRRGSDGRLEVEVEYGARVWVQTCSNGAGYWTTQRRRVFADDLPALMSDILGGVCGFPVVEGGSGGGDTPPPLPGRSNAGPTPALSSEAPDVHPEPGHAGALASEVSVMLTRLFESTTKQIVDIVGVLEGVAAQYGLAGDTLAAIYSAFLDDPGATEYHIVMAISGAGNDERLSVSQRLRLGEVAGEVLRNGIAQCCSCGSTFPPAGSYHGAVAARRAPLSEGVAPENLLDTIEALIAPYIGESEGAEAREQRMLFARRGGGICDLLFNSIVYQPFRELLVQQGASEDLFSVLGRPFDPTLTTADYVGRAQDPATHNHYGDYLSAAAAALVAGSIPDAQSYIDSAKELARAFQGNYGQTQIQALERLKTNLEEVARVLSAIVDEHAGNMRLWKRIIGDRLPPWI